MNDLEQEFRYLALKKLAETSGVLTNIVKQKLGLSEEIVSEKKEPKKIEFQNLGSVGPGTTVMMPTNPVRADGSVDIVINIRGIAGGDTKTVSSLGVNAVVVTAEAGGLGSKENQTQFGNAAFINKAVNTVLGFLKKKYPEKNIHRGKLVVSGFSGGGGAIAGLLTQRQNVQGGIDGVIINDGLHADPGSPAMNAVLEYAKEAEKNPDKYRFSLIHTAVNPGRYISTAQTANYLLQQLEMERQKQEGEWNGIGPKPVSQAQKGGVKITQLYDQEQPYMAKDPQTGQVRPNVMGLTSGGQHISSLHWMPNAFADIGLE
jgi:predicted esterase